ncbi:MAG: hypothetical protein A2474_03270 [Elusimicrobia bacterium RIFOXYC2_FULL_34_12]|nr:MAG: hypothetical protein A2474_03270 [Elusimicrobia bacterium RIFOXYC2_FULL_34_12]OGS39700.1 MAG: hypothetical protein A2551_05570 [Elusimicrobia bacterium RIFOXYD2_FULL_34_30]
MRKGYPPTVSCPPKFKWRKWMSRSIFSRDWMQDKFLLKGLLNTQRVLPFTEITNFLAIITQSVRQYDIKDKRHFLIM